MQPPLLHLPLPGLRKALAHCCTVIDAAAVHAYRRRLLVSKRAGAVHHNQRAAACRLERRRCLCKVRGRGPQGAGVQCLQL